MQFSIVDAALVYAALYSYNSDNFGSVKLTIRDNNLTYCKVN